MVWAASSMGRRIAASRSLRALRMPMTMPIDRVTVVATSTVVSVCIECSQSDARRSRTRQAAAIAAERRPEIHHASPMITAITSHHGALVRIVSSGLIRTYVVKSLNALVTKYRLVVTQLAIASTGSRNETVSTLRKTVGSGRLWAKMIAVTTTAK